jgi:hypothetical protein
MGSSQGTLCADFPLRGPELRVAPGETVTIALNAPEPGVIVDGVSGSILGGPSGVTQSFVVPAGLTLPTWMTFAIDAHDASTVWHGSADVQLTPQPPAAATVKSAKLKGRRLAVKVACAAPESCDGKITLKSRKLRIAQLDTGALASGAAKTYKVELAASRVRYLQRHRTKSLRAVVAPTKGAQAVSRVKLAR